MPTKDAPTLLFAALAAIDLAGIGGNAAHAAATLPPSEPDVEEVVVTAERLERGKVPSPTYMVQTYSVVNRGARLYRQGKYKEALPYLTTAAKRGFKWAQARTGDIHLHGRGGVPRNIEAGIGWLGVAATPRTAPAIRNYFKDVMSELPPEHVWHFATIVADYRRKWDSKGSRVQCERVPGKRIDGSKSLRIKRLKCTFMDEIPLCRTPYGDPGGGMEWICPEPSG